MKFYTIQTSKIFGRVCKIRTQKNGKVLIRCSADVGLSFPFTANDADLTRASALGLFK